MLAGLSGSHKKRKEAWQELMGLKDQGLLFTPMDYVDPAEAVASKACSR